MNVFLIYNLVSLSLDTLAMIFVFLHLRYITGFIFLCSFIIWQQTLFMKDSVM